MLRIALRNVLSRKLRFALTAVAIVLGTAMISGTYVLTDQITGAFDDIFAKANEGVDVVITKRQAFESQQGTQTGPLSDDIVDTVRAVPGVAVAEGFVDGTGNIVVDGKTIDPIGGAPALLLSSPATERFQVSTIVDGRFPASRGEMAIDVGMADREKLRVGQRVQLATRTGLHATTIVGVFKFADASSLGGATISLIPLADAQAWLDRAGQVTSIAVAGEPGTAPSVLKQRIQAAIDDPAAVVETGDESADRQAQDLNDNLGFLRNFLFVFAAIAILVGSFIIFNVFSITITQRIREIAMLRTIGATRRQIRRIVLAEAGIVGLVASILGIGLGVVFALLLKAAFDAAGFGLPAAPVSIRAATVVWPLVVGVGVTLVSAAIPAVRATRIPPVAALREGATLPRSRFSRYIPAIGVLSVVLGAVAVLSGFSSEAGLQQRLTLIGLGALLILVGVGMFMRLLIRPLARIAGAPLMVMGNSARLGRQNATRDPARTASTTTALMIGIGLVVFVAVFVDGFKSSFFDAIDRTLRVDQITINNDFQPMPAGVADVARGVPEVQAVLAVGALETEVDGTRTLMNAVDPEGAKAIVKFEWKGGATDDVLDRLGTDGAIVEERFAADNDLAVGDTFDVTTIDGETGTFRVLGVYRDRLLFTGYTVSDQALAGLNPDRPVGVMLTLLRDGVDREAGTAAVASALAAQYPTAKVRSREEYKDFINQQTSTILYVFYALLALSVLISLVGVVITLLLSIYERTREIGMMRAIGATRRQVRSMIRYESIITCAIGGAVGLGVGLFLGWVMIKGLEDEGLSFSVPVGTLIVVFIAATLAGILAAVMPAWRASKLRPLEALHYE